MASRVAFSRDQADIARMRFFITEVIAVIFPVYQPTRQKPLTAPDQVAACERAKSLGQGTRSLENLPERVQSRPRAQFFQDQSFQYVVRDFSCAIESTATQVNWPPKPPKRLLDFLVNDQSMNGSRNKGAMFNRKHQRPVVRTICRPAFRDQLLAATRLETKIQEEAPLPWRLMSRRQGEAFAAYENKDTNAESCSKTSPRAQRLPHQRGPICSPIAHAALDLAAHTLWNQQVYDGIASLCLLAS
jgi:hypothetical protein